MNFLVTVKYQYCNNPVVLANCETLEESQQVKKDIEDYGTDVPELFGDVEEIIIYEVLKK